MPFILSRCTRTPLRDGCAEFCCGIVVVLSLLHDESYNSTLEEMLMFVNCRGSINKSVVVQKPLRQNVLLPAVTWIIRY
jgi:hypothetical protein